MSIAERHDAALPQLLRRLGLRDVSLIVMGSIIGSGIFRVPSAVAKIVPNVWLIVVVWVLGGALALLGGGVTAELAARRPKDGGFHAYLSDAFHPALAFMYGWAFLLVVGNGGLAIAALTFAGYVAPWIRLGLPAHQAEEVLACGAIAFFSGVNALGIRQGANTQNLFTLLKIGAIVGLVSAGFFAPQAPTASNVPLTTFDGGSMLAATALAMIPISFAYSGWLTPSFMTAEMKKPQETLPRGLLVGVIAVVVLYLAVNAAFIRSLGAGNLAATNMPATEIAQLAFGTRGAGIMAAIIALSTLGFLSNRMLAQPRLYFQMAADGTFFKQFSWVHPRTHAPVIAIILQGVSAAIVALSGTFEQIISYATGVTFVFYGLSAIALIIFRARDARNPYSLVPFYTMPLHPWGAFVFLLVSVGIVAIVSVQAPVATAIAAATLVSGFPIYAVFAHRKRSFRQRLDQEARQ